MNDKPTYLQVQNVSKVFGQFTALQGISFSAARGEFISILGPSGCGKTTLLRVIAGLERQTRGTVFIEGRDVSAFPVSRRKVGIVFQSYALFPNLTARENIAYGLKRQGKPRSAVNAHVDELLDLVGLGGMGRKHPAQLSGGQQQRVALARAIAVAPDLLLLDEPLSALDAKVRQKLRGEIRQLQQRLGITTIMVTHDQEEALTMADRILVIEQGRLAQDGTPHEIYDKPASPFVANFIGTMNFIEGATKIDNGLYGIGNTRLRISGENGSSRLPAGCRVTLAIRPEDILLQGDPAAPNRLNARVAGMEYRGSLFRIDLCLPNATHGAGTLTAEVPTHAVRHLAITPDTNLPVYLPVDRLRVYANEGVQVRI
ncbi:Fe(3+) ions import ATP-binding protein FbpC 2 [Desulfosarcina cetonica]|uniref:putative 2-aminoethylphosphonate ABC transporter ATP-binding protein n=1 Tax=Desulfosarcina cetonica TaxID=90730 RepID=UPI0006CFD219|nr:putative 2-aminoethylphosphonate ABC transporter ATP-binding protein [Desulfosarcina cetonica]VTR66224.1 Fe(3+) ions import ATP-binding protein FbpC 2 [Desulfosarcina cetonica]